MSDLRRAPQIMGVLIAAYGAVEFACPAILPRQLAVSAGPAAARLRSFSRFLGVRDMASGMSMIRASPGRAQRVAVLVRCLSDISDGVSLAAALPAPAARKKILAVTIGYAAVNAAALVVAERS